MIDLHMHTTYSDGTWSLIKMLQKAGKANLELISITDHDTLDAYFELNNINYKNYYSGNILNGIELNVVYDGYKFELLAYDFDINVLNDFIIKEYKNRIVDLKLEFDLMIDSCKINNIIIDNIIYDETMGWPINVIYPEIKKHIENKEKFSEDEWNNIDKFFFSILVKKDFPIHIDWNIHYPDAKLVSDRVIEAGGKVFLAHAFRYGFYDLFEFVDKLRIDKIINGIEVYYSGFNEKEIKLLKDYCLKHKLLMSGGSDCHGDKNPERKIGVGFDNLKINKNILNNWDIKRSY